jgi:hypothetical protein
MKKSEVIEMVKTTIRLPKALWRQTHIRAMDDDEDFQEIVALALEAYLNPSQGGGR